MHPSDKILTLWKAFHNNHPAFYPDKQRKTWNEQTRSYDIPLIWEPAIKSNTILDLMELPPQERALYIEAGKAWIDAGKSPGIDFNSDYSKMRFYAAPIQEDTRKRYYDHSHQDYGEES